MLTINDIQPLNYSPDLTSTGIDYVVDGLGRNLTEFNGANFDQLRNIVVEKAVELAFRRYLSLEEVPHNLVQKNTFGDGEQNEIQMGGRKCKIVNLLISQRKNIKRIKENLNTLMSAEATVQQDGQSNISSNEDLYIFTAVTGLVTRSLSELKKSIKAEQPSHLIYPFPQAWSRPTDWQALGPIVVKGDSQDKHQIKLTGQDKKHLSIHTSFELPVNERLEIGGNYYSLRHIETDTLPSGAVGVHSPGLQFTLLIAPYQWGNLWIHGLKIYLLGFQSRGEFSRLAVPLSAGRSIFANPRITKDSLSMPIKELRPISDLFTRARDWANR